MDHMTSKSDYGTYEPSATGSSKAGGVGNVQQQILDALTVLAAPKLLIDDPKKLRDQFAMIVLSSANVSDIEIPEKFAKFCYLMADEMIKAREAK